MRLFFLMISAFLAVVYWATIFLFTVGVHFLLSLKTDSAPEWKSTSWSEIGLEENTGKLLAVAPFDESMLSESELFVVNEWVRPSARYVYGRIKLNPERKDFYREKLKGNPLSMDSERIKAELFPFISEIWDDPPDKICVLIHSSEVVVLTNAPEYFFEPDSFFNTDSPVVSTPYVYFYFANHAMF